MRTRKYMEALVGGQGNVLTHHKTIKDLEKYYASVGDNKDVQTFLQNVTSDKEGWVEVEYKQKYCRQRAMNEEGK